MAITVESIRRDVKGSERVHTGVMNLGIYATGGVAFTAALFGLSVLRNLQVQPMAKLAATNRFIGVDAVSAVVQVYTTPFSAEVANATDLSADAGMKLRFVAFGR